MESQPFYFRSHDRALAENLLRCAGRQTFLVRDAKPNAGGPYVMSLLPKEGEDVTHVVVEHDATWGGYSLHGDKAEGNRKVTTAVEAVLRGAQSRMLWMINNKTLSREPPPLFDGRDRSSSNAHQHLPRSPLPGIRRAVDDQSGTPGARPGAGGHPFSGALSPPPDRVSGVSSVPSSSPRQLRASNAAGRGQSASAIQDGLATNVSETDPRVGAGASQPYSAGNAVAGAGTSASKSVSASSSSPSQPYGRIIYAAEHLEPKPLVARAGAAAGGIYGQLVPGIFENSSDDSQSESKNEIYGTIMRLAPQPVVDNVEELRSSCQRAQAQIAAMEAKQKETGEQHASELARLAQTLKSEQLEKEATMKRDILALQARVRTLTEQKGNENAGSASTLLELGQLRSSYQSAQTEIASLEAQLKEAAARHYADRAQMVQRLDSERRQNEIVFKEANAALKAKTKTLEVENKDLRAIIEWEREQAKQQKENLECEQNAQKQREDDLLQTVRAHELKLDSFRDALERSSAERRSLKQKSAAEYDQLRGEFEALQKSAVEALQTSVEKCRSDFEKERKEAKVQQQQIIDKLRAERDELEAQCDSLRASQKAAMSSAATEFQHTVLDGEQSTKTRSRRKTEVSATGTARQSSSSSRAKRVTQDDPGLQERSRSERGKTNSSGKSRVRHSEGKTRARSSSHNDSNPDLHDERGMTSSRAAAPNRDRAEGFNSTRSRRKHRSRPSATESVNHA